MEPSKATNTYFRKRLKKQKRRTVFMFFLGILIGGAIAFNLYYWYPLLQREFGIPNIKQFKQLTKFEDNDVTVTSSSKEELEETTESTDSVVKADFQPRTDVKKFTSASSKNSDLTKLLEQQISQYDISGTILAVKDNQVVLLNNYGSALNSSQDPVKSMYSLASIQKMLTSILIMHLIEDQKLSLDTTLSEFYPDIPNSSNTTIDQLLSMTSDLKLSQKLKNTTSKEESIKYVIENVIYDPVGQWKYSDVNYFLLGTIIEKITGMSYESYFETCVKEPLNLENTVFYNEITSATDLIPSYKVGSDEPVVIPESAYINELGTGNMYASATDLLTIIQAMFDGKLVSRKTLDMVLVKQQAQYMYDYKAGFYEKEENYYAHGVFGSYEPTAYFNKDASSAVIFLSNNFTKDKANVELSKKLFTEIINAKAVTN